MRSESIFLLDSDKISADTAARFNHLLKAGLGEKATSIQKVPGGINSEAFKVSSNCGNEYFAKIYRSRKDDRRKRLIAEFYGLSFLWQNGIRNIPEPLLVNQDEGIAVYRFIKGRKIKPKEVTAADIDQAADFASRIHSLSVSEGALNQPVASEACFSVREYMDCISRRAGRLKKAGKKGIIFDSLNGYLKGQFTPLFDIVRKEAGAKAAKLGIDIDKRLHKSRQTLSASDFGFHNAIRLEGGRLFFFDFEYYGWDDPAKLISDFYLQPAVPVPSGYRERFFERVRKNYCEGRSLERRISIIYPLLGLKWCLIMLNVFLHIDNSENHKAACLRQLAKAQGKLREVKREMESGAFPYESQEP